MFRRTKETTSTGTRHGHESLGTQGWERRTADGGQSDGWTGGQDGRDRRGHGVGGTATDGEAERFKTEKWKGSNPPLNCAVAAV